MGTGELNAGGNPAMDWHPIQGGVEIFLVASCHGNRDKLRPGGPLGSYADFTFTNSVCNHVIERPRMFTMSMITDRIGRHEVLLPINNKNYKRRIAKLLKNGKIGIKRLTKEA